jgi:hypothetical protein
MKLKLSDEAYITLKSRWGEQHSTVLDCIIHALELAEVVEDGPPTWAPIPKNPEVTYTCHAAGGPEPTSAEANLRDFEVWWEDWSRSRAYLDDGLNRSDAYLTWLAATEATTKRLSK